MKQLFIFFFISFSFFSFGEVNSQKDLKKLIEDAKSYKGSPQRRFQKDLEKIVKESVVQIHYNIKDSHLLETLGFVLSRSGYYISGRDSKLYSLIDSKGFAIAEDILVTTSHSIEYAPVNEQGLKEVFVSNYKDRLDKAVVLVEEPAYDLAILKTKRKDYKPMELASEITLGENVYALGFEDRVFQFVQGAVFLANFRDYLGKNKSKNAIKGETIDYLMHTYSGMSGIPIVSEKSLKVVGIHSGSSYDSNMTMQYGKGINVSHI